MARRAAALGLVLLTLLLGCRRTPTAVPPAPPAPADAAPTAAAPQAASRLPAVIASISLALPGGEAFQPHAVAYGEDGRAVVLCYGYSRPDGDASALLLLDPLKGARGAAYPLPGRSLGPLAVASGRAYVGYQDKDYKQRLAAIDLDTGRVVADTAAEGLSYGASLAAGPGARLYALTGQLEVRDPLTLRTLSGVAYPATAGERNLALDAARDRLYLAAGERLSAYRASDLQLLWQATSAYGPLGRPVVDRAGRNVYARAERYEGDQPVARLVPFATASGQALAPLAPQGAGWQLVAADTDAGRLTFVQPAMETRLWLAGLDGKASGPSAALDGYTDAVSVDPEGRPVALLPDSHVVAVLDPADLHLVARGITGIEIRNVLADPAHERLYVNDSAGRVHAIDTGRNCVLASLPAATCSPTPCAVAETGTPAWEAEVGAGSLAPCSLGAEVSATAGPAVIGSGSLALDATNGLLFVADRPWGQSVAVLRTDPLTAVGVITGGDTVAVDSAGHRAFVGWAPSGMDAPPGEVAVWDTNNLTRLGAIAHRGAPAYNPLRDEVYLADYSAYVVDGKTLQVVGELTPDIGAEAMRWCNGCLAVGGIGVDPEQNVVAVGIVGLSAGKGPGAMDQPRLFSARDLTPVTHTVTVFTDWGRGQPTILPPDGGLVYESQRYARYVAMHGAVVYDAASGREVDYRDGLALDYYLPGTQVALTLFEPDILVTDARSWEPLGRIPYQPIKAVDALNRRLYAWEGSTLTALSFSGGQALPPAPAEPAAGPLASRVDDIQLSPAFARDRTLFAVAGRQVLRSTDGGASWVILHGGLPEVPSWSNASLHLAVSPAYEQDRTLFVAGQLGEPMGLGVWRSSDGGESWQPAWHGLRHLRVERLVISPNYARDHTLLAYCAYARFWQGESGVSLFRSTDGGDSWLQAAASPQGPEPTPLPEPTQLLPLPQPPVQLQAAREGNGVSRSTDGGRTWEVTLRREGPYQPLVAVQPSPRLEGDGQAFALFPDALFRSRDGGLTWQEATDDQLVRSDYQRWFTALAVGARAGGGLIVVVGDAAGQVTALDPEQLHWGSSLPAVTPAAPGPTATPAPPPTAAQCVVAVAEALAGPYEARWRPVLGCALAEAAETAMATQGFEHGRMFWRGDERQIYVLQGDGTWKAYADAWQEGDPDRDPTLQAPSGLQQPIRGFGLVWRTQLGGASSALGWAKKREQGYSGHCQAFAGGTLLTGPNGEVYALFGDGRWEREGK